MHKKTVLFLYNIFYKKKKVNIVQEKVKIHLA